MCLRIFFYFVYSASIFKRLILIFVIYNVYSVFIILVIGFRVIYCTIYGPFNVKVMVSFFLSVFSYTLAIRLTHTLDDDDNATNKTEMNEKKKKYCIQLVNVTLSLENRFSFNKLMLFFRWTTTDFQIVVALW